MALNEPTRVNEVTMPDGSTVSTPGGWSYEVSKAQYDRSQQRMKTPPKYNKPLDERSCEELKAYWRRVKRDGRI